MEISYSFLRKHIRILFEDVRVVFADFEWTSDATYAIHNMWSPRPLLSMYLLKLDAIMGLGMGCFDWCHHPNVQSDCKRVTGFCFVLVCGPVLYPQRDALQV